MKKRLFIGTSGWDYRHWKGIFYPKDLSQDKWLEYYSGCFNCVELNVTFYRMVEKATFSAWRKRTPKNFHFVVKGSRFITHIKRLKDCADPLKLLLHNSGGLKEKLAAILWQLPPGFKKDLARLENFLKLLKKTGLRYAFELRNLSWFDPETYSLLKKYNCSLCVADSGSRFPTVKESTADFLYLRFHGGGSLYSSDYSDKDLKSWADFSARFKHKDVFAFFNNDAYGYAVKNAQKFQQLCYNIDKRS